MDESSGKMPVARAEKRSKAAWIKTTVIWMVNFALYASIYWMLSKDPTIGGGLTVVGVCLGGLVLIVGIRSVFTLRRWRRGQIEINDAVGALTRGQLDVAYEAFARWVESNNTALSAIARHNLGWTLMRQGRLEEALAVLSNNDAANERGLQQVTLHGTSSIDLSLVCALLGKIEDAESWLQVTERRAATSANPSLAAMTVFARAVLDCRRERYEDAARLLDEQWPECEAALKGSELRPLRVVRAYAHAAMGPRHSGVADNLLTSSRPVFDSEYDFLGVAWPAMQPFLLSHRLLREPARSVADEAKPVIAERVSVVGDQPSSPS